MKLRFLVFAFAVVLASGCPQPGGVADGVRINSFGFDSSTIGDKEEVELSLEIENVGAYDAERVRFYVYGYDSVWGVVDSEGEISFPEDFSWGAGGLRGYNMEAKTPGLSKNFYSIFRVADDSISKGITKKYTFNGRMCYYYETKATGTIKTMSASQKRDEAKGGGFSQSGVSMKNSYAPIQVEVKTKSPLVFYGSGDMMSAELALIIRNAAGGYTASGRCSQDVDVTEINKIAELEVYLDGEALDCTYEDLSFYDGELVVYCDYSVESSQPKGEYLLSVVTGYYYYVDRSATISVVGSSDETVVGGTRPGSVADVVLLDNYCLLESGNYRGYCKLSLVPVKRCGNNDCIAKMCIDHRFTDDIDRNPPAIENHCSGSAVTVKRGDETETFIPEPIIDGLTVDGITADVSLASDALHITGINMNLFSSGSVIYPYVGVYYVYRDSDGKDHEESTALIPAIVLYESKEDPIEKSSPGDFEDELYFFDGGLFRVESATASQIRVTYACGEQKMDSARLGVRSSPDGCWVNYIKGGDEYRVDYYRDSKFVATVASSKNPGELVGEKYSDFSGGVEILSADQNNLNANIVCGTSGGTKSLSVGSHVSVCGRGKYIIIYEKKGRKYVLTVAKMGEMDEGDE